MPVPITISGLGSVTVLIIKVLNTFLVTLD